MKLLLDTRCWLWALTSPGQLNAKARALLASPGHELFLSAASAWEIGLKHALGKLELPLSAAEYVRKRIRASGANALAIEVEHALRASALPPHHQDSFDRILIAQAQLESLTLVTADKRLRRYDVPLFWAG